MSPRTAAENARIREETRRRIVDNSLAVFAERGFHAASMQEIARRARVSKGLAYHYFDAKEELLAVALQTWLDGLLAVVERAQDAEDPSARLAALVDGLLDYVAERPAVFRLYLGLALDTPEEVRRRVTVALGRPLQLYLETFEVLFAELGSPEPGVEALLLRSTLLGLAIRMTTGDGKLPGPTVRARLLAGHTPGAPL